MSDRLEGIVAEYRERVRADLVAAAGAPAADLRSLVDRRLREAMAADRVPLSATDIDRVVAIALDETLGYGPLDGLLSDPGVTEVIVNGPTAVYAERGGLLVREGVQFRDERHLRDVIERIVGAVGRRVDEASPMVDARLPDGSRVNAVLPPLAVDGPLLTVRRFPDRQLSLARLVELGSVERDLARLLRAAVAARLNIVVCGGTGSGKTTLLNALSAHIDPAERIVTVEDAAELSLPLPHVARLEARPPNLEGRGAVTLRALVRNALRMRPDRIIVGEVRGPEALDMLQAMNTGHDGSLTTVHAGSPAEALRRIEMMVLMAGLELPHAAVTEHVRAAVDLVVHVARESSGRRIVAGAVAADRRSGSAAPLDAELLDRLRAERRAAL